MKGEFGNKLKKGGGAETGRVGTCSKWAHGAPAAWDWAASLKLWPLSEPCRETVSALVPCSEFKPQKELEESRVGVN